MTFRSVYLLKRGGGRGLQVHASCTVAIDGEIENARYRIVEQSDSVEPVLVIVSDVAITFPLRIIQCKRTASLRVMATLAVFSPRRIVRWKY